MNTPQNANSEIAELMEISRRNDAIAQMLNFKKYMPSYDIDQTHRLKYYNLPLKWYYIPGVGRYNSFELKFHNDWNWLISCCIDMKKYMSIHNPKGFGERSCLDKIYHKIQNICLMEINLNELWLLVSEYAIELKNIKELENKTI